MIAPDNIYEFNEAPADNAENNWLQTWFNASRPTFERKRDEIKSKDTVVELLGKLYAESVEVKHSRANHAETKSTLGLPS